MISNLFIKMYVFFVRWIFPLPCFTQNVMQILKDKG